MNSTPPCLSGRRPSARAVKPPPVPLWKRLLDVGFVCLAAPVLLPLMFILSVVIKIVSPGPALFRQERVGYWGQRFTCFKFRTMVVDADTRIHQGHLNQLMDSNVPMRKLDSTGDPRLIPGGRLVRSLGLDELPQVFNVLRGEMSLVGPRPCLPYEYAVYAPRHRQRFDTIPGLTGLWQVSGKNKTTFEEMIDLDIYYATNKSLWLDLRIICKTIPAIIAQTRELKRAKRAGLSVTSLEPH